MPHGETLAAVTLGAVVATFSGILANQLEAWFRRRERERSAALLFGEILSTIRVILEGAERSRHFGEPYGPVTRRMLRTARREIDIYDRNREGLLDLRDARLRVDMHTLIVRLAMPLDGVLDSLADFDPADDEARDRGIGFINESLRGLPPIVARLGKVAGHDFQQFEGIGGPIAASDADS